MGFSKVVQEKMQELNLKVADIARLTGFSWTYCSDLLKGRRRWNEETMEKVCRALGLELVFVPAKEGGSGAPNCPKSNPSTGGGQSNGEVQAEQRRQL